MCELWCHLNASHLWEVWKDLYEQILEVQNYSLAPTDEFEIWSRRFWHFTIDDREAFQSSE